MVGPIGGRARARCRHELAAHRAIACLASTGLLYGCVLEAARMHQPDALAPAAIGISGLVYAALALAVILRWPPWVLVSVTSAGAFCSLAVTHSDWLAGPALLLCLFLFSLYSERRAAIIGTAGVIVAVVVGQLLFSVHFRDATAELAAPPWAALAAALGQAVRAKRAHEAMLTERARQAEEGRDAEARRRVQHERLRIARELHDAVGHHVALISVQAGAMQYLLDTDLGKAKDSLSHIQQASEAALEELRLTVGLLRQPGEAEPVEPASGLGRLDELIGSFTATGLPVTCEISGPVRRLPEAVDLTAYRVIQESLTNTAKHAPGAVASVRIDYQPAMLALTVEDDGDPPPGDVPPGDGPGHGIVGMRERAAALGGWLAAGPRGGGGFRVAALLPIPAVSG